MSELLFNRLATKYSPEAVLHAIQKGHLACFTGSAPVDCMEAHDYQNSHPKPSGPEEIPPRAILDGREPRWKPGARARLVYADGSIIEGVLDNGGRVLYGDEWSAAGPTFHDPRVYLIAEAPDPDTERREALVSVVNQVTGGYGLTEHHAQKVIDLLREKNWSL